MILLNGPPGVGKSTSAARWAHGRAATVVVEVDDLRTAISGWEHDAGSRLEARRRALELVERHLRAGDDVIVPQYLGRVTFIDELERTALAIGAGFTEVRLRAPVDEIVDRFVARRATGISHPERDVEDVREAVVDAVRQLDQLTAARPDALSVIATGDVDATVSALAALLEP